MNPTFTLDHLFINTLLLQHTAVIACYQMLEDVDRDDVVLLFDVEQLHQGDAELNVQTRRGVVDGSGEGEAAPQALGQEPVEEPPFMRNDRRLSDNQSINRLIN